MSQLAVYLLGLPRIELDDVPIQIDRRKALALLMYLAINPQPHSRDTLATLFWPGYDQTYARANLRRNLSAINQVLGKNWLEVERESVTFPRSDDVWIDVAQFHHLLASCEAHGHPPSAVCPACLPPLTEAVALYHDDFLTGFTLPDSPDFDDWQLFQAEALRQELAEALERLAKGHAAQEAYKLALAYARRWLALNPLHEPAQRRLMQLYVQAGDPAAALRQYQECVRLLEKELGVAPSVETTELFEAIRAKRPPSPPVAPAEKSETRTIEAAISPENFSPAPMPESSPPTPLHNLPLQLTSFIGREKEIAEVKRLLTPLSAWEKAQGVRLVTLTGTGGVGKTRLSLQVATELLHAFPNGVWLVELAALADPVLVVQTVAVALGLREDMGRPMLDILIDHLRAKTALLFLDNCEHLAEACAQLTKMLLQQCPDLRILVSSREALGVPGERVYRVPSLSFPLSHAPVSDLQSLLQYESTRLFIERAATALPSFTVTKDNALAIAQICYRLDGIPLAIELAAARIQMLRVEQIATRLDDRFRLLTGGNRTALPRHQTLCALIDWSYDLLSEPERALLRRLSVFAGGWTLEAAEAVCQDEGGKIKDGKSPSLQPSPMFDLLTQLVNKSIVLVERVQGEEAHYRLLETIRQYGHKKLEEAGEANRIRHHHLDYFLNLAEQAELELIGPRQVTWLGRLDEELDNIRVALGWSLERNVQAGLRLAGALMGYWEAHSPLQEGVDWLLQLLNQPGASVRNQVRAKALMGLSYLKSWQNEFAQAHSLAEEGLALYQELGDPHGVAFALDRLGRILCLQDGHEAGRPLGLESLALYRTLGDPLGLAEVLGSLGRLLDNQDYARARAYLEESLAICRELGHVKGVSDRLRELGLLALRHADYASARSWLTESLELQRTLGGPGIAMVIDTLGELALKEGEYEQARAYLEESVSLNRESGQTYTSLWSLARLGYVALRQGDLTRAYTLFMECQRRFKEVGWKIGVVYALEGLASLAVVQDRPERAVCLFAWADAMRQTIGNRRPPVEQADVDRDFAIIRAQLDEAVITAAQAEGRAMTLEQAIAYALEMSPPAS